MGINNRVRSKVTSGLRGLLTDPLYAINRDRDAGDPGICGPGSASWEVLSDPAALFAGVRALLFQACHPSAIAGVEEHSNYREDVLGRLRRTVAYVTLSVFGSTSEATDMATRVKNAHRYVKGIRDDGVPYDAADPRLLLWVHVALVDSLLVCHQTFGKRKLSETDCDRFIDEQSKILALLGVADGPRNCDSLRDVIESFSKEVAPSDGALRAYSFIKNPPLPWAYRLAYPVLFYAALETLSPAYRAILGDSTPRPFVSMSRRLSGAALSAVLDASLEVPESREAAVYRIKLGAT